MRTNEKSWNKFEHSTKYLANGSSTGSKIPLYKKSQPALISKGKGCRIWDCDGNEYIDYRNGLGPITLGYQVPEIDTAIKKQLENGILFGQPHELEGEVAEMLVDVIPCAQRVRFLKTGGEACSASIKIARAATGRNLILQSGYNGWLNTLNDGGFKPAGLAKSNPLKGIPEEICNLHHYMPWNDISLWEQMFEKNGNNIAAVIISCSYPEIEKGSDFLPKLCELAHKHGSLMIMDEIVTGFRLAIGGAHEYFNFTPDIAVFAKGLSNGMPLSAYVGRADLIDMSKEIGISSTFGGETLSLAAAKACINFYRDNKVIDHLWNTGKSLWQQVNALFKKHNIKAMAKGFEVCPAITFDDLKLRDKFLEACFANGVSLYNVSYVNYSHKEKDVLETLQRIEKAILSIKEN